MFIKLNFFSYETTSIYVTYVSNVKLDCVTVIILCVLKHALIRKELLISLPNCNIFIIYA